MKIVRCDYCGHRVKIGDDYRSEYYFCDKVCERHFMKSKDLHTKVICSICKKTIYGKSVGRSFCEDCKKLFNNYKSYKRYKNFDISFLSYLRISYKYGKCDRNKIKEILEINNEDLSVSSLRLQKEGQD